MSAPTPDSLPAQIKPRIESKPRVERDPKYTSSPYEPVLPPVERLDQIDLLDQKLYQQGDPHAAWRLLREQAPVFWHERGSPGTEDKGFWVLSHYEDIAAVYKNPTVYTSVHGPFLDLRVDQTPLKILASIDGAEHRKHRAIVSRLFTPQALAKYTEAIRSIVTSLLDAVAERGECDFSSDIAGKLPLAATCELLGISAEEAASLAAMLFAIDPQAPEALKKYNDAALDFFDAVTAERRRSNSRDTIAGLVAHAQIDGEPLPQHEILHMMWILFFGGIDSTVHAATGGMLAFFHHPDQWALLRNDPSLFESAVEEVLRWSSTSHANKRKTTQDIQIRGTWVKKGDYVSVWSPSANRDAFAFEDPYRFDVRRTSTRPIAAFGGGGPHYCLGQYYARLELRVLLEELVRRCPDIEQAGPAVRSEHFTMLLSPVTSLPVKFSPHAQSIHRARA